MLGRLVPRSIALICDTLSLVSAASSFSDQFRATRISLIA